MSDFKRPSDGALQLEERASIEKRKVTTSQVRIVTHTETVEELVRAVLEGRKRTFSLSNWIRL